MKTGVCFGTNIFIQRHKTHHTHSRVTFFFLLRSLPALVCVTGAAALSRCGMRGATAPTPPPHGAIPETVVPPYKMSKVEVVVLDGRGRGGGGKEK